MNARLRRLRGVISLGATWGAVWAAIFAAITIVVWSIDPEDIDAGEGPIRVGAIGGIIGLVSGVAFGILLSVAESRKAVRDLALTRAAMWGLIASAPVPLLTGRQDQVFVLCPIGVVVAVAAVAIARKAEAHRPPHRGRFLDAIRGYVLASVRDTISANNGVSMRGSART